VEKIKILSMTLKKIIFNKNSRGAGLEYLENNFLPMTVIFVTNTFNKFLNQLKNNSSQYFE
jgi:hypothetical protein